VCGRSWRGIRVDRETEVEKTWAGGMAQVVECLTSKSEALISNPSTFKKKEKQKGKT
jgi:hypothetical protein